jgi:hypothetical protein
MRSPDRHPEQQEHDNAIYINDDDIGAPASTARPFMNRENETGPVATLLEGSSDPQAKQAPANGGMRGERTGGQEAETDGYARRSGGLDVVDTSGVAHVEAQGTQARRHRPAPPEQRSGISWRWLIAAAAAGFALGVSRKRRAEPSFEPDEQPVVRGAGPEHMRDPVRREWTRVDQASDESFPASDPPGSY